MKIILFSVILLIGTNLFAQEKSKGVEHIWESRLCNHYTATMQQKGQTSIYVIHYFSTITENGFDDLFGIFGSTNVQLGAEYGISNNFTARYSTEKLTKSQELGIRYRIVQENKTDATPVSVALDFSVSLDSRDEKYFGENFYFVNRFFYTTQIIVSKQIGYRSSAMINGTIAHFNIVPDDSYSTFFSVNPSFAFKTTRKMAVFCSLDLPLGIASAATVSPRKANSLFTAGTIFRTPTHNFQLFISNGNYINPAKEYLNNHSGFSLKSMRFGFNIHVKLGLRK